MPQPAVRRRRLLAALALLLLSAAAVLMARRPTPTEAPGAVRSAEALLAAGDRPGAEALLAERLKTDPADAAARLALATLHRGEEDRARAEALLSAAPEGDAGAGLRERLLAERIGDRLALGRLDEADRDLEALAALGPSARLFEARVRRAAASLDREAARAAIREGLAAFPKDAALRTAHARDLAASGGLEEAAADLAALAAGASGVDRARAFLALGELWADGGEPFQAELAFRRALAADPDLAEAEEALGRLLASADRPAEAAARLLRSVELAPWGSPMRLRDAARATEAAGDVAAAARLLETLRAAGPAFADVADAESWRVRRRAEARPPSSRPETVRVAFRATARLDRPPERLFIAGSWDAEGRYADAAGWRPAPMERASDGSWVFATALGTDAPLGYGFVLDDDGEPATGALYTSRLALAWTPAFPLEVVHEVALTPESAEPSAASVASAPGDGRGAVLAVALSGASWHGLAPALLSGRTPTIRALLEGAAYGEVVAARPRGGEAPLTLRPEAAYTLTTLAADALREARLMSPTLDGARAPAASALAYLAGGAPRSIWRTARRSALDATFSRPGAAEFRDAWLAAASGRERRLAPPPAAVRAPAAEDARSALRRRLDALDREADLTQAAAEAALRAADAELVVVGRPEFALASALVFDLRRRAVPGAEPQPAALASELEDLYAAEDRRLAELLALADADDTIVLFSTPGPPCADGACPAGLLIARGPAVRAAGLSPRIEAEDLAAALLRLAGAAAPDAPWGGRTTDALFEGSGGDRAAFGAPEYP